jgi:hypothetical protein
MTFATPVRLALVLSAGALTLSACGSSYADTKPAQVQKDVEKAMSSLKSVRIEGEMDMDGQQGKIDLAVDKDGNCEGSFSLDEMGSFEIVSSGGKAFFKPDAKFWTIQGGEQGAAMAEMIGDKWVAVSEEMGDITEVCDLEEFTSGFEDDMSGKLKVGESKTVDGEETVAVTFTSEDDNKGTAHVLATEPHYVVDFDVKNEGTATFSDFNEPVKPKLPAAADTIDLSELAG